MPETDFILLRNRAVDFLAHTADVLELSAEPGLRREQLLRLRLGTDAFRLALDDIDQAVTNLLRELERCADCREWFTVASAGRRPKYCSRACAQRALRSTRTAA